MPSAFSKSCEKSLIAGKHRGEFSQPLSFLLFGQRSTLERTEETCPFLKMMKSNTMAWNKMEMP